MPMQDLLRFADHLTREAGLVIDAFLQHGSVKTGRLKNWAPPKENNLIRGLVRISPDILKMKFVRMNFVLYERRRDTAGLD